MNTHDVQYLPRTSPAIHADEKAVGRGTFPHRWHPCGHCGSRCQEHPLPRLLTRGTLIAIECSAFWQCPRVLIWTTLGFRMARTCTTLSQIGCQAYGSGRST